MWFAFYTVDVCMEFVLGSMLGRLLAASFVASAVQSGRGLVFVVWWAEGGFDGAFLGLCSGGVVVV